MLRKMIHKLNGKSLIVGAALAVFLLIGSLVLTTSDQARIENAQCQAFVQARNDNRAVWQEVRRYLNALGGTGEFQTNAFIAGILRIIPKVECVAGEPVEVELEETAEAPSRGP